ncbi:MAG: FHA domain-containing protein [Polyangiaceae bacterium]
MSEKTLSGRAQACALFSKSLVALVFGLIFTFVASAASAFPEAHIVRIDPRAGVADGTPLLTTVIELGQFNSISDAMLPCANVTGAAASMDCISAQMEKPKTIWTPFAFPNANAQLLVTVNGAQTPSAIDSVTTWGASKDPGVGTAWLFAIDASASMGTRYDEERAIVRQFIEGMGPNDLADVEIFDDRQVIQNSKWKTFAQRNDLINTLNAQRTVSPSHGSAKPLFDLIKGVTTDGFSSLGNTEAPQAIPLHQAEIILSNGAGRDDASSAAPTAAIFSQFATTGRFPEDNTGAPKTPLPIISIWLPTGSGLVNSALANNDQQFMRDLSNPQIGGFFDIVRPGQGVAKGAAIINVVKTRFNGMYVAKWRLSCLAPAVNQTFDLEFTGTSPQIKGDQTFKDVPIGVDPSQWPLDIDVGKTQAEANANPVYPGGSMKIFGNFCWGSNKQQAEAYYLPSDQPIDPNFSSTNLAQIQQARQKLIAEDMRGACTDGNSAFAVFDVPKEDNVLAGSGDQAVVRVLIADTGSNRVSSHDAKTILTLKGTSAPFNMMLLIGIGLAVVVILLLVVLLFRGGGGGKKKSRGAPPPQPVVAGGYGGPPPNYGGPPGGGGYGGAPPPGGGYGGPPGPGPGPGAYGSPAQAPAPMAMAPAFAAPMQIAPALAPVPIAAAAVMSPQAHTSGLPSVVQVDCPACHQPTMATPGQASVCFSCGQPLPADIATQKPLVHAQPAGGGAPAAPPFH